MSDSLPPHELHHARLLCPSLSPWVSPNSCPFCQWSHPTISSSVSPFSSCPQFFPAWIFPVSQVFASGGHSFGASALASALPINIQGWVPLGLTGLISLLSKGLSRVFYSTTKCLPSVFLWALPTWCGDTSDTFLLKDGEVLASCAFIPCPILPCVMLTVRYQLLCYMFLITVKKM